MILHALLETEYATDNLAVERNELRLAITAEYEAFATDPNRSFVFQAGRILARRLGYNDEWLQGIPEAAIDWFAGTGNPFSVGEICAGQRVIDVGCGAGLDSLLAAKKTGPHGWVIGIDMTCAMLEKALIAAEQAALGNLDFRFGFAEELHMPDGWADVVISNGVLNLVPNKSDSFGEMARVLKPGGRVQISDILAEEPVPEATKGWNGPSKRRMAGALTEAELKTAVQAAGFVDFEIASRHEVLSPASLGSAFWGSDHFGVTFLARKAVSTGESHAAGAG